MSAFDCIQSGSAFKEGPRLKARPSVKISSFDFLSLQSWGFLRLFYEHTFNSSSVRQKMTARGFSAFLLKAFAKRETSGCSLDDSSRRFFQVNCQEQVFKSLYYDRQAQFFFAAKETLDCFDC